MPEPAVSACAASVTRGLGGGSALTEIDGGVTAKRSYISEVQHARPEVLENRRVSIEQREFARIETNVTCSVATASTSFEATIINLSLSGAALVGPPEPLKKPSR